MSGSCSNVTELTLISSSKAISLLSLYVGLSFEPFILNGSWAEPKSATSHLDTIAKL